jgi:hypothetical protein
MLYLKVDPTVHIFSQLFKALPIFPNATNSISASLLSLVLLGFRYVFIAMLVLEHLRAILLGTFLIFLSVGQFKDAFDFQVELFKESKNSGRQIALKYVLKYREILMIRDTFYSFLSLGLTTLLFTVTIFVICFNYVIIKMFAVLPTMLCVFFIYVVFILLFLCNSALKEGAAFEQASLDLLKSFRIGANSLQGKDHKYVLRAVKSLPPFSLYIGLPGFNILKLCNSTTTATFVFIMDQTVNALLTF